MYQKARIVEIDSLSKILLDNIDLVLLDLDNTLYEYKRCHEKALQAIVDIVHAQLGTDKEQVRALYLECRKMVNMRHHGTAVSHSRLFYLQAMVEKLCNTTDVDLVSSLYKSYWDTFIEEMILFPDAQHFLDSCLSKNIPIVLVTDMTAEVQFQKIKKLNIAKYFQFIVTSEEAGVEKPNPFIFELAIGKAQDIIYEVKNIAVVGDDPKKDIYQSLDYLVSAYLITRE